MHVAVLPWKIAEITNLCGLSHREKYDNSGPRLTVVVIDYV